MLSLAEATALAATVGSGVIAGLCFTFAAFLMRALDELGPPAAIRAMQAINKTILRSSAMAVWFGTLPIGVAAAFLAEERAPVAAAAVLYGIGAILITGRGNVPLNEALDRLDPEASEAAEAWLRYRRQWGRWNAARTLVCALACAGFALGV